MQPQRTFPQLKEEYANPILCIHRGNDIGRTRFGVVNVGAQSLFESGLGVGLRNEINVAEYSDVVGSANDPIPARGVTVLWYGIPTADWVDLNIRRLLMFPSGAGSFFQGLTLLYHGGSVHFRWQLYNSGSGLQDNRTDFTPVVGVPFCVIGTRVGDGSNIMTLTINGVSRSETNTADILTVDTPTDWEVNGSTQDSSAFDGISILTAAWDYAIPNPEEVSLKPFMLFEPDIQYIPFLAGEVEIPPEVFRHPSYVNPQRIIRV